MNIGQSILSPSSVADLVSQYGNSTVAIGYIRDGTFSFEILGSGFLSKTLENYFVVTTCAHVVTGFNGPIRVRFSINLHFVHYCKIIDSDVKTDFALLGCIKTDNFPEYAVNAPANLPSEQYQATGMVR